MDILFNENVQRIWAISPRAYRLKGNDRSPKVAETALVIFLLNKIGLVIVTYCDSSHAPKLGVLRAVLLHLDLLIASAFFHSQNRVPQAARRK